MLVDFGILKGALREVLSSLDHTLLNELPPFTSGNPSAELIAKHIFEELAMKIPGVPLVMVEVFETDKNCAAYVPSESSGEIADSPRGERQIR